VACRSCPRWPCQLLALPPGSRRSCRSPTLLLVPLLRVPRVPRVLLVLSLVALVALVARPLVA